MCEILRSLLKYLLVLDLNRLKKPSIELRKKTIREISRLKGFFQI